MPDPTSYAHNRSSSTTFAWKRVKIAGSRRRPDKQAGAERRRPLPAASSPRDALTITITYRGGAESWWLVQARGRKWVFPGWAQIEDVARGVHDPAGTGWYPID